MLTEECIVVFEDPATILTTYGKIPESLEDLQVIVQAPACVPLKAMVAVCQGVGAEGSSSQCLAKPSVSRDGVLTESAESANLALSFFTVID